MTVARKLFCTAIACCVFSSLCASFSLKKEDAKSTLDEMFSYHVEYHEFSPFLAKRALKVYLEQFDPAKVYLLSSEVRGQIDPSSAKLVQVVNNLNNNNLSDFQQENALITKSVHRARAYRQEIAKELISSGIEPIAAQEEPYTDYASSEIELKKRIRDQLLYVFALEKQGNPFHTWTPSYRQKVFDFWQRRFARLENPYLFSGERAEHYIVLHTLKAVAKSLDAHTTYFSPEEAYEMRTSLEKQFEGIGVVLREGLDGVVIYSTIQGGPAHKSGQVQVGDVLIEINGVNIEGASYEEVLKQLKGSSGSRVQIGVKRHVGEQPPHIYRVDLKREKIVMQEDRVSYSYEPFEGGILAKVTLPAFYEGGGGALSCEQDLKEAMRALRKHGEIKGMVLDMRENSGGFLTQAVKVSGLFMTSGIVVISKYAKGMTQYLRDLDGKSYYGGPLVILASKASASAAEIVAQALQDYGVAVIAGDDRTYGKGTIQYQTVTDPRATSFFKVTIGRYYTVSGRTTQIDGVKADVHVPTLYSAFPIGERYLEYPLRSDRIPSAYSDPLVDVDPRHRAWFQKNYIPTLQKKLSVWTQMMPTLRDNSRARIQNNPNYTRFLKTVSQKKNIVSLSLLKESEGGEDLQMNEAVDILMDMVNLKGSAMKKASLLLSQ